MKVKLTDLSLVLGLLLVFGPFIFEIDLSPWLYYCLAVLGVVLASISGYNAQASMTGLGEPGEDLLQSWLARIKKWLKKFY